MSVAEKFYSSYKLSEMSADTITQEDHKLALSKQNYVRSVGKEIKDRSFGSLIYRGDMVVVPGENALLCKYRVTQFEWMMVFDEETCGFWMWKCGHGYGRECSEGAKCSHGFDSVRRIDWDDCRSFMNELNEIGNYCGLCVRFPTESEWEVCQDLGGHKDKKGARDERDSLGLYSMCDGIGEWCDYKSYGSLYRVDNVDDMSLRLAASLGE